MNERTGKPVLIFDTAQFDAAVEALGYETKEAKADFLGVSRAAYSKVTRGLNQPSPTFIAAVLVKLPVADKDGLGRFFKAEIR